MMPLLRDLSISLMAPIPWMASIRRSWKVSKVSCTTLLTSSLLKGKVDGGVEGGAVEPDGVAMGPNIWFASGT